jgi:hypothetical protein
VESKSAQVQLEALAASRELALERMFVPRRYVIGWAILMNGCMLPVVLPIFLSEDWTLLIQAAFLVAMIALLLTQLSREGVKRPRVRVQGAWILSVICAVSLGSALAVAIYARSKDDPWLGAAALLINFAGYLVVYGGLGFLVRRQVARLT